LQQSRPVPQHTSPQQVWPVSQVLEKHGGRVHLLPLQYGVASEQTLPHPPQLLMSLLTLTHRPLQHLSPKPHA
jgi:hypothetical protein